MVRYILLNIEDRLNYGIYLYEEEFGSFDYDSLFAFQGVPNAKGYGSLGYTYYFDGEHIYDGTVVPSLYVATDENGVPYGGKWASLHSDIFDAF